MLHSNETALSPEYAHRIKEKLLVSDEVDLKSFAVSPSLNSSTSRISHSEKPAEVPEFLVYPQRFYTLVMFSLINMANSTMWVTFSPISDEASCFFDDIGNTAINMLAVVFSVLYLPGTFLGNFVMKKTDLRTSLILGGSLTLIGCLVRLLAAALRKDIGSYASYSLMLIGQSIGAIGQPIFMNIPALISSQWFPVEERDMATTVASMFNPLGNAIGQIFPTLLITSGCEEGSSYGGNSIFRGMVNLMLLESLITLAALVVIVRDFQSCPPTPPSASTSIRGDVANSVIYNSSTLGRGSDSRKTFDDVVSTSRNSLNELSEAMREERQDTDSKLEVLESLDPKPDSTSDLNTNPGPSPDSSRALNQLWKDCLELYRNKDYCLLLFGFSMGLGLFNAVITLLNQILEPYGYTSDDAGFLGAILIITGLIGAGIAGVAMDRTHAYKTCLLVSFFLAVMAMLFFVCMVYSDNFVLLCFAAAVLGLGIVPLVPIVTENCAECTYPVPEDVSVGMLLVGGNVVGIGLTFLLQFLITLPNWGPPPFLPVNLCLIGILSAAGSSLLLYKGEYRRLHADK